MPKADRIFANLPPTFRAQGDPSALRALVDAYGGELQSAENSLVAVMRAHWADFADAGESRIVDLALFGALYGLAPRDDESVEEFRDHLKRYVRTLLDGTVTVRGIVRITAEALGLHIEDDALDTWWTRPDPVLVTELPRGADAATLVLGFGSVERLGHDALPAVVDGDVDLRTGVDLRARSLLRIALDGHGAVPVDVAASAADPAKVTPAEIAQAVNDGLGVPGLASVVDGRLRLMSASTGTAAEIVVADGPADGGDLVLGLRPRAHTGADATHARVTGTADLSNPVDLRTERYLRIVIDGNHVAEIDCAARASDPGAVEIDDVAGAIDDALGIPVATHDGRFLTLTSPTAGAAGFVAFAEPAAQSATARLFGPVLPFTFGTDPRHATVQGDRDLGLGVDLRSASRLRLSVDARPTVIVDVAGADPAATMPGEIVTAVNEALQDTVASHNGQRVTLASSTPGAAGSLAVEEVDGDAAESILGLRPRVYHGSPPATANLTGTADLSAGVDLSARHLLVLDVDGGPPVEVELRDGVADVTAATVDELARAVNAALDAPADDPVATHDGAHLILVSRDPGAGGRIAVLPLVETRRRRFVTRARVTDDAATVVFGFTARRTTGSPAVSARIAGSTDLSGGADLSVNRWLRLGVDAHPPQEIMCAGPRPRATTPAEIVAAINTALPGVAVTDGRTITLVSPTTGADSRLVLEPPLSRDVLDVVGLDPQRVRGSAPTGVRFTGTTDLSQGVELPAHAALRLAVDGGPAIDIPVGDGTSMSTRTLGTLVVAVNQALAAQVAAHDGTHLLLVSPQTGTASRLDIQVPTSGTDVTAQVLGIAAPRTYHGQAATSATLTGRADLTSPVDLTTANLLRLAVDGGPPVTVDLRSRAADATAVTGSDMAAAINADTDAIASTASIPGGTVLTLRSPTTGLSSRLDVQRSGMGDAGPLIFGGAGLSATGIAPTPAVLDADIDLRTPVDLDDRSIIRLSVDGGPPVDVDLVGGTPNATTLPEIVGAVNDVLPGLAAATADDKLRLTSPTEGPDSSIEVIPLRQLEVEEYPPAGASVSADVRHGTAVELRNTGAAAVIGTVELATAVGVAGPRIADPVAGWSVRVLEPIGAGGRLLLTAGPGGIEATVVERGRARRVPADRVQVEPTDPARHGELLLFRRGRNTWRFYECRAARFDSTLFGAGEFAGGPCTEDAVFGLSRFGPPTDTGGSWSRAVFADVRQPPATARITVRWRSHAAGRFVVNLPRELDRRFGVAFGDARFGTGTPELFAGVVTEPLTDPNHIQKRLNDLHKGSKLVEAAIVPAVPIGWSPVALPFRDKTPLTLGRRDAEARLYLSEPGLAGQFVQLTAAQPGTWGNDLTVTGRASGPATYDIEVHYPGGRFEVGRRIVAGPELPTLADQLRQPGPVGVLLAKAAGIRADVTRDGVAPTPAEEGTP